jgi:hypothetical protein
MYSLFPRAAFSGFKDGTISLKQRYIQERKVKRRHSYHGMGPSRLYELQDQISPSRRETTPLVLRESLRQALGVVGVCLLTSSTSCATGGPIIAYPAALAPFSAAATGGRGAGNGWRCRGRCRDRRRSGSSSGRANGYIRGTTAVISFGSDYHIVERAQVQSKSFPCVEVVAGCNGSADTVRSADRQVLVEGCGSYDGRLVDTLV